MVDADGLLELRHAGGGLAQRLLLAPELGGGIAAWQIERGGAMVDVFRPWNGDRADRYTLASFAMLPWSNRISGGGFMHRDRFHPMTPNRAGEPYPIHGDGWLQRWQWALHGRDAAEMALASRHHRGDPYAYDATQRLQLVDGGLDQSIEVTHRGDTPLPYGLGLHPWFPCDADARVTARVDGVWLAGSDPIPVAHTTQIPPDWDLNAAAPMRGDLIDNAYTGWDGFARIDFPQRGHAVTLRMHPLDAPHGPVPPSWCLVYRPPGGPAFCVEPITQPIDAFHLAGAPGLVELAAGETLRMRVSWRIA